MTTKSLAGRPRWLGAVLWTAAALTAALAAAVLAGWHTRNPLLTQIHPVFAPMQYNAALAFLAGAAGLVALGLGWRWPAAVAGGAVLLVGGLTLAETLGGFDLHFDDVVAPAGGGGFAAAQPGRMDPSAALCFVLTGLALLLMSRKALPRPLVVGLLGSTLLVLSALVCFGYLSGVVAPTERGHFARMALTEVAGFAAFGLATLAFALGQGQGEGHSAAGWLPLAVGVSFAAATVVLWQALTAQQNGRIERLVQFEAAQVRQKVVEGVPDQLEKINELATYWALKGRPTEKELGGWAGVYLATHPACQGVAALEPDGALKWLQALRDAAQLEKSTFGDPGRLRDELRTLVTSNDPAVRLYHAPAAWRGGRRSLVAYVPIVVDKRPRGGLLAVFHAQEMLDSVLNANVAPQYAVEVYDAGQLIYNRQTAERQYENDWGRADLARIYSMDWLVRVWPTPPVLAREAQSLAKAALVVGVLMAGLLSLAVHLALTARRRARALEKEVADRRLADAALRRSEMKYRCLVENLEHAVFLKDRDLRFVAANRNFCASLGVTEAEIVGKSDLDFYPAAMAEKFRADDRRVLLEGQQIELEEENQASGRTRVVRVVKTPVKDDRGEVTGVLGIFWDVTTHRALEQQLRQSQKMEAVGQLAGGVAHDFNNLLTAVLGNIGLVQAQLPRTDPRFELLAEAEQASLRAAQLTRQLLGFSRRTVLRTEPTDLNFAVQETARLLKRTIDPRIAVEVRGQPGLWIVQADPGQMNQVLMNLCLNARDAMPQGGRLLLDVANVTLDEEYARYHPGGQAGEFVRLRVEDTGHGMSPEIKARIFEPFFTTKGPGKGTGLGLAMVFGIVQQHQGWVDCYSEIDRGARFDIYLPRAALAVGPAPEPEEEAPRGGTETILLADDEAMIRNLGRAILQQLGYRVLLAEDGQEAVEVYRDKVEEIDLVVLDLTMPRLSGRDAFRQLVDFDPEVRVLFASGYSAEHITSAEQERILGFVNKPYRPPELARTVRAALDRPRPEVSEWVESAGAGV